MKAYKDRPIVRKISVKCHHAFVIPVQFVAVIASRNVFSAMHAAYRHIANSCRWIEILGPMPCLERRGMRFFCPACATTHVGDGLGKIAEKFVKICLSPKCLVAQNVAQVSVA